ncbi:exosome complex component RRP43-like protein [Leptotrombidium deliense]|uniref:Ribosomal RNA-processing protein 43 n=1 Tax=Leptotrombidium deliense TaxID=299467 RepID=A0A443SSH3_9ACAR|nr:exosome complex component RRP43-like protein [Leptotrombidium deliense]
MEEEQSVFDFEDLRNLLSKGERIDGRQLDECRQVLVNRDSIANGTVLVKIGETAVICGLKTITRESEETQDLIEFSVEFDNLSPKKSELRTDLQDSQRVTQLLKAIVSTTNLFDSQLLNASTGNFRWMLSAEIIALNNDGNLFDASLLAFLCALHDIRIPVVEFTEETSKIKYLDEFRQLKLLGIPVSTSFALFGDNHLLIDPNADEELASSGFLSIIFDVMSQKIVSIEKRGGFSLDFNEMNKCIATAKKKAIEMKKLILNEN